MITVRKLLSLPWKTRVRKIARILWEIDEELQQGSSRWRAEDLRPIVALLGRDEDLVPEARAHADRLAEALAGEAVAQCHRELNSLRHRLFAFLGHEPADWDVRRNSTGELDRSARTVHDIFVYLDDLRSPFNVGAIFRTAESFGVRKIFLSPECPSPEHSRARRSSMGASDVVDWSICGFEQAMQQIEETMGCTRDSVPVIAVETGGMTLGRFRFPDAGVMILGSEELGVNGELLRAAEQSAGRLTIPQAGSKASLNVGVAFGIVAHAWFAQLNG